MESRDRIPICSRRAFTLVELLVVIAIIGVLVALLLPAIQAAREAARRTQCANQVRQMSLSMLNHEAAKEVFPSGGNVPWPRIEDYLTGPGGAPFGPRKQGLGWAFQILPYLEGGNTYDLRSEDELDNTYDPMFFCPSKRGPTRLSYPGDNGNMPYLMDYAAAVPYQSAGDIERPVAQYVRLFEVAQFDTRACNQQTFWGGVGLSFPRHAHEFDPNKDYSADRAYAGYHGVVVRSDMVIQGGRQIFSGFYTPVSVGRITDGTSNTLVLGEKFIPPSLYDVGHWADDKGWNGGWDPDGLRSTCCKFEADRELVDGAEITAQGYRFGAAHSSGMNAGFADGSVHFLNYDIDLLTFNRLGHRADGQLASIDSL